ncbi:mitogen-activated protein kinase 15 isoform X1 [Mesocricetus auratus]|uniref:Mitogen-activated protein kinase 15 isoform X1 n=1 Tax=Mesocricetus auratus TaxID=10036 RepID=A0ABM2WVT5_MESAU|nr:mitogen-activated protein kinase 15 isoform X1 [Mesocricetus auratus]
MCAAEVDRHVAQRYLIKRRLGKGAYGIVWKAVDRRTGDVVAIKKIFDAFRDQTDAQRTFREVMLLQEFGDHPNIIRLLDVIPAENDRDIYLVFESMDTDLNAVIQKGKLLEDIHKRCIFYQLLRATKFIHSGRVIHRDQKPANVLLDAACRVKLCDFGLARSLSDLSEGPEGQALTEYVATRWYRAPEVLLSSRWYTPGVDMWSLGCILGEMLRGQPLFPGTSTFHQLELILETIPLPSMEELQGLGSDYSALILQNLGSKPRQTLDALLPPDTPPEALDLLKRLLAFAPDKRLSAEQALQHPYVQRFHCPDREWTRGSDVRLPVHEGDQLTAPEYRNRLYQMILERRGNSRSPREEGLWGAASRAELRACQARAQSLKPGVLPQVSTETPARKRGPRPQSSPGHNPEPVEVPRQNSDPLFQLPPPGRGERPPGATAEPPSVPSGVKTHVRVVAPSLTSQAAAQAANQALIRSDPFRGGGPRAAGARRVSPALPSSLQCGLYPPEPCSTPLPPEQDPRLRAGPFPPAPGRPGTPAWPKDVWHLGLPGGPGRSQSCTWRLLPSLRDRVPLGAGPPAPAPRTACVSRPPTSLRQPGAVPQPPAHLPPLTICIRVPGGFSEPLSPKGE